MPSMKSFLMLGTSAAPFIFAGMFFGNTPFQNERSGSHAQEDKTAAKERARAVVSKLRDMKLKEAAKKVEDSIVETLTYMDFPIAHWIKLRSNNVIERLN